MQKKLLWRYGMHMTTVNQSTVDLKSTFGWILKCMDLGLGLDKIVAVLALNYR